MTDEWPRYYVLVGRVPIAVDADTWARSVGDLGKRRVALDQITDRCNVSTVFLGLDHNFGGGDPVLFETLVFGGPLDGEMERHQTYDEAERGHAEMVAKARVACAKVGAIASKAGAS